MATAMQVATLPTIHNLFQARQLVEDAPDDGLICYQTWVRLDDDGDVIVTHFQSDIITFTAIGAIVRIPMKWAQSRVTLRRVNAMISNRYRFYVRRGDTFVLDHDTGIAREYTGRVLLAY